MATQKPISSISYNSEAFLLEKLQAWEKAHIIQAYMYIKHKGEDGDKDHIHFRIEPNKKLDPMDLKEELKEYVIGNKKPLGCRPFRPSKEEDWFLYVVHDKEYLELKYGGGEKGEKIPYKWEDIVASEDYDVEIAFIRAKAYLEHTSANLASKIQKGAKPIELIQQGENPYLVNSLVQAFNKNNYTEIARQLDKIRFENAVMQETLLSLGYAIGYDKNGNFSVEKGSDQDENNQENL